MRKNIQTIPLFISCIILLLMVEKAMAQTQYPVIITTTIVPPVGPFLNQALSTAASGIRVMVRNASSQGQAFNIKILGRLERISPSPFTIQLNTDYRPSVPITLKPGETVFLSNNLLQQTFGNFQQSSLSFTGISFNDFREGINYKLPEGIYNICFYARGYQPTDSSILSNPTLGCAMFTVCNKASAPQFIQPVNNLNINSLVPLLKPVSPVIFTWIPPQATCALRATFRYDFEIREILDNQTVTDAVNNPFVFRKTGLTSTTFLLDTNLYRNVLQQGKKYIIRVRATAGNARDTSIAVDNYGYSRVEAFQYGGTLGTIVGPTPIREPQFYFIPFKDRRSEFWDDVLTAYQDRKRGDTLVPLKEYIALALTQDGIVYNLDAIELFLTLNPNLADAKAVKISYTPVFPVFPKVAAADRKVFDAEHAASLAPDASEEIKFRQRLDSVKRMAANQKIPDNAAAMIRNLINQLNTFNTQVHTVNRVSLSLINSLLSELLYAVPRYAQSMSTSDYDHLQIVGSNLLELTELSPISTGYLLPPIPAGKRTSLSSYQPNTQSRYHFSLASYSINEKADRPYFLPVMDQLLPIDVVVWYQAKEQPPRPVLDAPDLRETYRIFYTVPGLYYSRNPEINAKTIPHLASTSQVSLPPNSAFKFWTLNMLNHRMTKAVDVDSKDVFLNSKKRWPNRKNLTLVLKVE